MVTICLYFDNIKSEHIFQMVTVSHKHFLSLLTPLAPQGTVLHGVQEAMTRRRQRKRSSSRRREAHRAQAGSQREEVTAPGEEEGTAGEFQCSHKRGTEP